MWSTGAGRAQANDTVAGSQGLPEPAAPTANTVPTESAAPPEHSSHRVCRSNWQHTSHRDPAGPTLLNELPNRAPPLPVVHAMVGWGFFHGHTSFAVSLLIGFYTMLRSGELLGPLPSHIRCAPKDRQVLISLSLTKGGKRQGAAESVNLGVEPAVKLVRQWKSVVTPSTSLAFPPVKWRTLFSECLKSLGLEHLHTLLEEAGEPGGFKTPKFRSDPSAGALAGP